MLDKNYRAFFPIKWAYYLFFKFFLSFADAAVFVSKNNLREAERIRLGRRRFVIYNGLSADMAFLSREESRNRLKEMTGADIGEAFLVGSIGRLSPEKNYDFLLRIFPEILKKIPAARGVIVGDGPLRETYRQIIAGTGLGEKFFLVGEIGDAAAYLKGFDIFVLPSRYEGLPVTLEECLFAGVPALASDVGGNNEILQSGHLYRLDDDGDFMEKFVRLLHDGEPSGAAEDTALKEIFSADHMAAQYLRLFKQGTITGNRAP
jgi:glycosyltransferase involved in cell wall biosynthesis